MIRRDGASIFTYFLVDILQVNTLETTRFVVDRVPLSTKKRNDRFSFPCMLVWHFTDSIGLDSDSVHYRKVPKLATQMVQKFRV